MKIPDLPEKTYLTPEEVARFFTVSKSTIYHWCEVGELDCIKIQGVLRVYRMSVVKKIIENNPFSVSKSTRKTVSKGISQK